MTETKLSNSWLFGERVQERRKVSNLTQKKLGDSLNVSSQVVSNWERGYTKSISADMLQNITKVLNCTADYLLGNVSNPNESVTKQKSDIIDIANANPEIIKLFTTENIKKIKIVNGLSADTLEKLVIISKQLSKEQDNK
jgi:transcriptional regulator with XRE-family HTH domain